MPAADGAADARGRGRGRQDLEKELEDSIECLRQMGIMLEQHSGEQNEGCYFDKINEVVAHYGRLYAMRGAVRDKVPVRVIEEYLDKGLNPELYTKHRLQEAEQMYQVARAPASARTARRPGRAAPAPAPMRVCARPACHRGRLLRHMHDAAGRPAQDPARAAAGTRPRV